MNKKKPCYIWDKQLIEECDRLPAVGGRASMVHDLIVAYDVLKHITVVKSSPATYNDLKEFHSELYLDHLKKFTDVQDDYMTTTEDEECGIGYDCPPVSNMYGLVSTIAGGSITAARCLLLGITDVAINWCGGWHHAHRFGAEGFCYVNDIVIAIEKLRRKFPKVLYVDLDAHHGNGVQDAYNLSKSVFTLSFHKFEPGFYPGTGSIDDIGTQGGMGYCCNFPLHAGYGGYRHDNTARLWTSLTALVAEVNLDELIPDHSHWPEYGPDYTLPMVATLVKDANKSSYIDECIEKIHANLIKYLAK
ncbi:histone deacetylase 8-like isoform X2 [Spodoptera litura]|uniref:Histone deacetylase 8 n=1 Tax=Spodoptera litura TaxID=69820 RepID=A0A9J7J269_SPOLT|nr:histone deacetylase 8-like isoform X2 [Spodoptera litura]